MDFYIWSLLPSLLLACSMEFKSGEQDGHSVTSVPAFCKKFHVTAAVRGVAFSCGNVSLGLMHETLNSQVSFSFQYIYIHE